MNARPAWILAVLTAVNITNHMDRQLIAVLLPSIKAELLLTDLQIGMVTGVAFALFYSVLGLPLAWVSERVNRRRMLAGVVALWSLMTALTGLAGSYVQLLLCRIGVAVGEAGGTPPSYAMVSDSFPPRSRAAAMSVFTTSGPLGSFVGLLAGGWIAQYWGWRTAFYLAGLVGVVAAPLVLIGLRDPGRGRADGVEEASPALPFHRSMAILWSRKTFLPLALGGGFSAFAGYSLAIWAPSFLMRSYGVSTGVAGTLMAVLSLLGGVGGTLAGGFLARRFGTKDMRFWLWVPAIGFAAAIPIFVAGILAHNLAVAVTCLGLTYFGGYFYTGPLYATANTIVPPAMRSTASASLLLIQTLIGLGLGPLCIGAISDFSTARFGSEALRYALLVTAFVMMLAVMFYGLAARHLRGDAKHALAMET